MTSAHTDTFVRDSLPPPDRQPLYLFERPELQFPAHINASSLLDDALTQGLGDNAAVLWNDGRWTYRDLHAHANRVARFLHDDMGLVPGNRVLIHAPNTPLTIAIWWGVVRAGGVAVMTMPMLRATELKVVIEKARVSHALVHSSLESEFELARGSSVSTIYFGDADLDRRLDRTSAEFTPVDTASDDPAIIAFTSGTTGQPKGCVHFHRDILAMARTFSHHIVQPSRTDVLCGTPPYAFTFGLGASIVFPAASGAATAIPAAPGFDALADAIAQHKVTTLFTAPTGYRALTKIADERLATLHTCVSAGEHLPQTTSDAWRDATGVRLIDGIGSTEMIHIFISARGDDIRPGATGKAVPGYVAAVMDDAMRPLPPGETGRLAVRGPTGCRYLADPRQSRYVVDGWNITGDLYRTDADGYFWFIARADDMIISAGYNIAAPEVETALLAHEHVAEAAVIGVADEERGQICKAFVVLRSGVLADGAMKSRLQDFVKRTIAPYKYPRALEFVDVLPRTPTGKLQRYRLKETP